MWERFLREAKRSQRGFGILLFAVGLTAYGLVTGDGPAVVTGLVIAAVVVIILVIPGVHSCRSGPSHDAGSVTFATVTERHLGATHSDVMRSL